MWRIRNFTILIVFFFRDVSADCNGNDVLFNEAIYTGSIVVMEDGSPHLMGDNSGDGISLIAGCMGGDVSDINYKIVDDFFSDQFSLGPPTIREPANLVILLSSEFSINTNTPLSFSIEACDRDVSSPSKCAQAQVHVQFPFNHHSPSFNRPSVTTSLDVSQCAPQCIVDLQTTLVATDADGDRVTYSLGRTTPNSEMFSLEELGSLSITYNGGDLASTTIVTLLIWAYDSGHVDTKSGLATITVKLTTQDVNPSVTTSTQKPQTDTPPVTTCNEDTEDLYFIIMLTLASVLGAVLIIILLVCIIVCCRRCGDSKDISSGGSKPSMKNAGIYSNGATYKSYPEMNYVTLHEDPMSHRGSNSSLPTEEQVTSENGRVRVKSKSHKRAPVQNADYKPRDSVI